MKCDYCDKKATVFLTQLAEGQMKKVCLCDRCADERGVTDPTGFSLADMLLGGVQDSPAGMKARRKGGGGGNAKACPQCGFDFEEFQKVRRFGCGECYRVFSDELARMLPGMHKGLSHIGKVPAGLMETHLRNQRLEDLRARLEQAIASESYEDAAGLRDEIRNLDEVTR